MTHSGLQSVDSLTHMDTGHLTKNHNTTWDGKREKDSSNDVSWAEPVLYWGWEAALAYPVWEHWQGCMVSPLAPVVTNHTGTPSLQRRHII